jgi:hypothetical protein
MPSSLATVIKRVDSKSNAKNRRLVYKFEEFMKDTAICEKYQKDNLFVILLYASCMDSGLTKQDYDNIKEGNDSDGLGLRIPFEHERNSACQEYGYHTC